MRLDLWPDVILSVEEGRGVIYVFEDYNSIRSVMETAGGCLCPRTQGFNCWSTSCSIAIA